MCNISYFDLSSVLDKHMSSEFQSFVDYVSLRRSDDDDIEYDTDRMDEIRKRFEELHEGKTIEDGCERRDTLKILMTELKMINDQTNFQYLDLVVEQKSDDGIKIELEKIFRPSPEMSEPIDSFRNVTRTSPVSELPKTVESSFTPSAAATTTGPAATPAETIEIIDDVICIVHQKSLPRDEIHGFFREFLLLKVQPPK